MLTPEGQQAVLGLLPTWLDGATLRVGDGEQSAEEPLDEGFPAIQGGLVVLQATFGIDTANFEWKRQAVVLGGVEVDVELVQGGMKAQGTVWVLKHTIEPVPLDGN